MFHEKILKESLIN